MTGERGWHRLGVFLAMLGVGGVVLWIGGILFLDYADKHDWPRLGAVLLLATGGGAVYAVVRGVGWVVGGFRG